MIEQKWSRKKVILGLNLLIFAIAFITYYTTMAPTMSFWDCGEFISCAAKLEVGHAPGAPLYLLIARFFSIFASSDAQVAWWINLASVFFSALTVMILFASIVDLLTFWQKKFSETINGYVIIIVAGVIGSLSFAFTDTFWFSAVEAEVYALSMFFTAITFWMVLQWRKVYRVDGGARWIVLISYIIGLSIGVHLLNLLTIPVLSMIVYQHIKGQSIKNLFLGLGIGLIVLFIILYGIVQNGLVSAAKLEFLMVNSWQMPVNLGLLIWVVTVFIGLGFTVWRTYKKHAMIHLVSLNLLVLLIGFSSYALIIIRAQADTPINLNAPKNVMLLNDYLNRKQYGDKPLLKGPSFKSQAYDVEEEDSYQYNGDRYVKTKSVTGYKYHDKDKMLFPRMHSNQQHHKYGYQQWVNISPNSSRPVSMAENLAFFFKYQLNFMYFRYFMWNFSGRQDDIQGYGAFNNGNWISGIPFVDELRLGNRDYLYGDEASNHGRNTYFLIPFLIGLIGILVLIISDKQGKVLLAEVGLLFLVSGVFIVLYLNQTPFEPRERDYAYVGSFYAFSLFIGFGAFKFLKWLANYGKVVVAIGGILLLFASPLLLATQNYHDHDRSENYLSLDMARSYLESCDENAILFTYGDNDTYPLWYAQEIEGIRTDIRVLNIGLLTAKWYVQQAAMAVNKSAALKFTIPVSRYNEDDLSMIPKLDRAGGKLYPASIILGVLKEDNPNAKVKLNNGKQVPFFPANSILLDSVQWDIPGRSLHRGQLAFIDIISSNIKDRPIYITAGAAKDAYLGLDKYCVAIGTVKQLITNRIIGSQLLDKQKEIYMNRISLRNDTSTYYNETDRKSFLICRYREGITNLVDLLMQNDRIDDAKEVIKKSLKEYPVSLNPEDVSNIQFTQLMFKLGMNVEAQKSLREMALYRIDNINYFQNLSRADKQFFMSDLEQNIQIIKHLAQISQINNQTELLTLISQVIPDSFGR